MQICKTYFVIQAGCTCRCLINQARTRSSLITYSVTLMTPPRSFQHSSPLVTLKLEKGVEPRILRTVDATNDQQKNVLFNKINEYFDGDLNGKTVAVWGLSFKPRTDDIREAPSLVLIRSLLEAGAKVQASDPVAMDNVRAETGDDVTFCDHHYDACAGADALAIVTEWSEFRNPDFDYIKVKMNAPVVFDGRNLYDRHKMAKRGFYYTGIGLNPVSVPSESDAS